MSEKAVETKPFLRVRVNVGATRPAGPDAWDRREWGIEADVPSGSTAESALKDLELVLEGRRLEFIGEASQIQTEAEPKKQDQCTNYPLVTKGNIRVGTFSVFESRQVAHITPEKPFSIEVGALQNFLVRDILEPMKRKHGLDYELQGNDKKQLTAIVLKGPLDDARIKELRYPIVWTFEKALERTTQ